MAALVLPIYIVMLVVGGLMGYLKAKSRVSLITSVAFAVALAVFAYAPIPYGPRIVLALQLVLLVVFAVRLAKTRKFMPAGLMVILTLVAIALQWTLPVAVTTQ